MREGVPRCVLTRIPFAWQEVMNCDDPYPPEMTQGELLPHEEEEGCPVGPDGSGPE